MSAVWDTWRRDAPQQQEASFATMQVEPADYLSQLDEAGSTANHTLVGSAGIAGSAFSGSYVVAYSTPFLGRTDSMLTGNVGAGGIRVVRSENSVVRNQMNTTTMNGASIFVISFDGASQRGIVVLNMPRKKIHAQVVSFYTAQLKRKSPRVILGGRAHGEENA